MDLAQHLKEWRKRADISQPVAAERLEMPVATLRGIERGRPFKYERMLRLAIDALKETAHGA